MILLSELLDEDGEAAAQAKQMGLISKGWGRWADPRTGKVTHKTDGGQLVAVDPQQDKSGGEKEIGPKPTQSKLGQIAKDLKGKVGRASTKRQRAKAGADADFDAVEKLRQITSSPQDFEKASKMYHQGHDMKDIEAQFANKKKPSGGQEPDLDKIAKDLDDNPSKADQLKRAQKLRQSWKQMGNTEDQATFARDFPKQYALDVVHQQGKELSASIAKGIKGSEGKNPQWKKDAAKELRRHKQRVEKIRELPDDTQFSGDMDKRRTLLDKLRGDGDDTVSGMKGIRPRIIRR